MYTYKSIPNHRIEYDTGSIEFTKAIDAFITGQAFAVYDEHVGRATYKAEFIVTQVQVRVRTSIINTSNEFARIPIVTSHFADSCFLGIGLALGPWG